jgi:glycerophosphoryl diester phosphodiesterase
MTKIIGHRGAAGVALENTRESLRAALAAGVDMIEFDTRLTADDHLVVMHDPTTVRVAPSDVTIRKKTLAELQNLGLHNGEPLISLDEALDIASGVPVIIEVKDSGSVDELLLVLAKHPKANITIASFEHEELRQIRRALPGMPIYVLEHYSPIDIVHTARQIHATGIGLNFWLMNPLTYRLATRYGLELYVYTVDNPLAVWFLRKLYPRIHICTNHPQRFVKKSKRSTKTPRAKRA